MRRVQTGLSPKAEWEGQALLDRPADTDDEIRSLKTASGDALRARWRSHFRKPYPGHLPKHLITGMLAWQLQADRDGGLSKEEEKYLTEVAAKPDDALIPRFGETESRHQAGTVFVREYAGVLHRAVKTSLGFEWNGQEFQSLSAVAFGITGTKWNGLRFFGVTAPGGKSRAGK